MFLRDIFIYARFLLLALFQTPIILLLQVYKGDNEEGEAVHSGEGFSGSTLPDDILAAEGKLFIRFTSDAAEADEGFKASFSIGEKTIS